MLNMFIVLGMLFVFLEFLFNFFIFIIYFEKFFGVYFNCEYELIFCFLLSIMGK